MANPRTAFRFDVAFSFAGSHREKVREIAEKVRGQVGAGRVFFDEWFEAEILGPDMAVLLQSFYHKQSLMVVADRSEEYAGRSWCQAEARAIRALHSQIDSARDETARLRFLDVRFGTGEVSGTYDQIDGIFDGVNKTADQCADVIVARLAMLKTRLDPEKTGEGESAVLPVAPPPPDFAKTTELVAQGLRALRVLEQNEAIRSVVVVSGPTFAATKQQLVKLGDYKDLHDQLHILNFECVNPATQESRKSQKEPDNVNWSSLDVVDVDLAKAIVKLGEVASRSSVNPADVAWVPELVIAGEAFKKVIANEDAATLPKVVRSIVKLVALRPPNEINRVLIETARQLSLRDLDQCLQGLLRQLTADERSSEAGQHFADGAAALSELRIGLRDLTEEHDRWQLVASEMREINVQLQSGTDSFFARWEKLRVILGLLCAKSAEPWAAALREVVTDVDTAIAAGADEKIVKNFRRCFGRAGMQFFRVDYDLKVLCGELRKIAAELG
jgi:hypothetical protein